MDCFIAFFLQISADKNFTEAESPSVNILEFFLVHNQSSCQFPFISYIYICPYLTESRNKRHDNTLKVKSTAGLKRKLDIELIN
jgi:hypothetical protein